jgi:AraC-like DNA-binding protein
VSDELSSADPLGAALQLLRMNGIFYCRCELSEPWALSLPPFRDCMMFHVVTSGEIRLEVDGEEDARLRKGELALLTRGEGHRLRGESDVPAPDLFAVPRELISEKYELLRMGQGRRRATVMCGVVRFDHPAARQLVALLPKLITFDAREGTEARWVQGTISFMTREATALQAGGETVITRLADVLVIQAIRSWIAKDAAARTGWFGALRDAHIGRALTKLHREPTKKWTLTTLAAEAGLSRSGFAARFKELVGETAVRYAARLKMQEAFVALRHGDASVSELASRFDYESEAAFSRAFKRLMGVSPGVARRGAR